MLPYQIEGSGHPLLLIHGWGVTHAVWPKLVPLLTPHFQLILVELPGAGMMRDVVFEKPFYPTCAEALEELRIALGIEKWAILAYSTGTRVCETYMQKYSTHVTRAVFLCPIYLRKSSYMLTRFFLKINAKHSHVVNWLLSDWRLYGWLLVYGFNLQRSDYINDWMNEIKLLPSENLKRVVTDLPGAGRAPFILPISPPVPTLFVWGLHDALTAPPSHPRPNDEIIVAGHSAPLLNPHNVAEAVLPFLKKEDIQQDAYSKTVTPNA